MLVNHRHRFLFVHIPKTGGATFREYNKRRLGSWWRKGWEEIEGPHDALTPEVAERFKDYYKFTIVRDPWRMIASAYRFSVSGVRHDKNGVLIQRDISILEWLNEKAKENQFGPFPCQFKYISAGGQLLVDYVCRQDQLADDMQEVLTRLKLPYHREDWEKPKRHYYGAYDWKSCFDDPAVRARVMELCQEDFDHFKWPWPFEQTAP